MQSDLPVIVPDWPAPKQVRALVTTRAGGVSQPPWDSLNLARQVGDAAQAVAANRLRLRALLPAEPVWLEQLHGVECVDAAGVTGIVRADAAFATATDTVCSVLTADCLPILACDTAGAVVGVAHAGWRGLVAGVIESLVEAMRPGARGGLMVWLGPAIGPTRFQVGPEVREAFTAADPGAEAHFVADGGDRLLCDLHGLARRRLAALGIGQVFGIRACTFCETERFFSYRREPRSGRFASCIWIQRNT